MLITPVILCGGFGRRLWPMSRPYWPKPFLNLGAEHTLLQQSTLRLTGNAFDAPVIICNEEHRFGVAKQLQDIGVTPRAIILEPHSIGTAAAVMFGLQYILNECGGGIMAVTPADHIIEPANALADTIVRAAYTSNAYDLTLIGVEPSTPASDYGYICFTPDAFKDTNSAVSVSHFVEKPERERAIQLLADGHAYWNSGVFVFDAATMLDRVTALTPALATQSGQAVRRAKHGDDFLRLDVDTLAKMDYPSFDIEIVEKLSSVGVAPLNAVWRDMGTWKSIWEATEKNVDNNVLIGNVTIKNVANSLVISDGPHLAVGEINDIAVIASGDSIVVCPLDASATPAELSEMIAKADHLHASLTPSKLHRIWGSFEIISTEERYQIKQLRVDPGKRLSLQRHQHRSEHWVVISGKAKVTIGDKTKVLEPNQSVFVPAGELHRLANDEDDVLVLIELQTGNYLGEDDIERIEDDYQRT